MKRKTQGDYYNLVQELKLGDSFISGKLTCIKGGINTDSCGPIPRAFRLPMSPCFQLTERAWILFFGVFR